MDKDFNRDMLSSININFLFGSGVNGKAFGQFDSFDETKAFLSEKLNKKIEYLEPAIDELISSRDTKDARDIFDKEFEKKSQKIDYNHPSIENIYKMFKEINTIVSESENRVDYLKKVKIFTLNYDSIVEMTLQKYGYLCNVITPSNLNESRKYFYMIGYDIKYKHFIPTYLVVKVHGDKGKKVLPGSFKYKDALAQNIFELQFKMKEELLRENSLLIVIGYKGNDGDINLIINDAIAKGLTVFWYCYSDDDVACVPKEFVNKISCIEVKKEKDSTLKCAEELGKIWEK